MNKPMMHSWLNGLGGDRQRAGALVHLCGTCTNLLTGFSVLRVTGTASASEVAGNTQPLVMPVGGTESQKP